MYIYEEKCKQLRKEYHAGTKLVIHFSEGPPFDVIGTVISIDEIGTIHCELENGRDYGVMPGIDSFDKLSVPEKSADIDAR